MDAAPKRQVSIRVPSARTTTRRAAHASGNGNGSDNKSEIAQEIIAVRAYFISERRLAAGIPGDSFGDWLEAERQLRDETR